MTTADRFTFAQAFNRLAVATRLKPEEADGAMQRIYWDGLADLPMASVTAAAEVLAKTAQYGFPKLPEWREAATKAQLQEVLRLPAGREEPWQDECQACGDTGWEEKRCYPGTGMNCGRKRCMDGGEGLAEHTYVYACSFRASNRTYQRRHCVPRGREQYGE